jgi:DNA-binding NarL/FixJ family response regulator
MKILVVDDHALIREAMRTVLRELVADVHVLEAASGHEVHELTRAHPDLALLLLDLRLPDSDGLDLLAVLRRERPSLPVVMMSAFNDRDNVTRALEAGASGFIPKTVSRDVLTSALRLILAGGMYIPPDVLGRSAAQTQPQPPPLAATDSHADAGSKTGEGRSPQDLGLTDRQIQVLALMMQGKSNKLICRALSLAEPTVKNHVSAILKVLGASNRTEAVLMAGRLDWRDPN